MNSSFFALLAVFLIAGAAEVARRATGKNLCTVCAGVAGTWITLSLARIAGYGLNPLIIGIMMGGSVVGVMYQAEKRAQGRTISPFYKLLFIVAGFAAAYAYLEYLWTPFLIALAAWLGMAYVFFRPSSAETSEKEKARAKELEEKMKKCC
ncbi:hypothetical protein HYV58_02045 [Candidatus Peregrinibacteria bacterium]|nr:hypothetical protein [Candidatus Peregrinibacteria bacterium]